MRLSKEKMEQGSSADTAPTTSEKDAKIHKTATAYREGMGGEERGGEKGGK